MYSQAIADQVCELLADGLSLRKAAERSGTTHSVILGWVKDNKAFSDQYTRAREIGYQLLADEIIEISDDSRGDTWVDDDGNERTDTERVARSKLRMDSRKWMLSKMLPKLYGDKVVHQGDPDAPVVHRIELVDLDSED